MEVVWTKVLATSLMLIVTFLFGMLPLKIRKIIINMPSSRRKSELILSAILCFGAGVLMGTVFLHVLPETSERVHDASANEYIHVDTYPLGELLLCSGFFFMYFVEELVHIWVHRHQVDVNDHHHVHHHVHDHQHNDLQRPSTVQISLNRVSTGTINKLSVPHDTDLADGRGSVCHNQRKRCESTPTVAVLVGCDNPVICTDTLNNCTHNTLSTKLSNDVSQITRNDSTAVKPSKDSSEVTTMRSILVVLALSVHGCLEGLAMGLEEENGDVWLMFAGLTSHKITIGFSIGMELLEKGVVLKYYLMYMIMFSLASPIGVLLGTLSLLLANHDTAGGAITIIILQGFSGGAIMYVVFCEVLERERCKTDGRLTRLLALISGFILMACLQLVNQHSHSHEDHVTSDAPHYF